MIKPRPSATANPCLYYIISFIYYLIIFIYYHTIFIIYLLPYNIYYITLFIYYLMILIILISGITVNHSGSGGRLLVLRLDVLGKESEVTRQGEDVENGR